MKKRYMLVAMYQDGSVRGCCTSHTAAKVVHTYECDQRCWWVYEDADFYVIDKDFTVTDRRILRETAEITEYLPEAEAHIIPYKTWYQLTHTDIGSFK